MPETAVAVSTAKVGLALAEPIESARDYARASKADSTLRAYDTNGLYE